MKFKNHWGEAQKGFTLVELMIVVAIVGILASIALPAYQNYMIKAKIANALSSMASLKTDVAHCAHEFGGVLSNCATGSNGVPTFTTTKEIASATVANGVITVTLAAGIGSGVDGNAFTMTPSTFTDQTSLTWKVEPSSGNPVTNPAALGEFTKHNIGT